LSVVNDDIAVRTLGRRRQKSGIGSGSNGIHTSWFNYTS
jgi:hypothetical protein